MSLLSISDSPPERLVGKQARKFTDYQLVGIVPFVAVHIGAVWGLIQGASASVWMLCIALFWARIFGVTGGYHRYFSHRTYKTSRPMQFLLALLAQSSSQKGALWWAAQHRNHHKYSDTERDVHSPKRWGFWYAHFGWLYDSTEETDYAKVKDLAKYPELVILNKLWWLPPALLGFGCWLAFGWEGLWVGFMLSTVITWHATFTINSLAHVFGSRRFETTDTSRNNFWLALLTFGEGWHNNHHHFMGSTRQGFYWWEIDITYYVLKAMSWLGLVWDLKDPPARVYEDAAASRAARALARKQAKLRKAA